MDALRHSSTRASSGIARVGNRRCRGKAGAASNAAEFVTLSAAGRCPSPAGRSRSKRRPSPRRRPCPAMGSAMQQRAASRQRLVRALQQRQRGPSSWSWITRTSEATSAPVGSGWRRASQSLTATRSARPRAAKCWRAASPRPEGRTAWRSAMPNGSRRPWQRTHRRRRHRAAGDAASAGRPRGCRSPPACCERAIRRV